VAKRGVGGLVGDIAANPAVFAMGVGVANGVLAAVRDKPISPSAAAITAAVIAAGEVALVYDVPLEERPNLVNLGLWSVVGTYVGLAPFVSWKPGEPSMIQRAGESLAEKATPVSYYGRY
jgi:hypothetical protein